MEYKILSNPTIDKSFGIDTGTPQMKLLTAIFMGSMALSIKTVFSFINFHNHSYSSQAMNVRVKMTHCERNVRSPGTSQERAISNVRVLVPLDRGLSASGSAHSLSFHAYDCLWTVTNHIKEYEKVKV